MLQFDFNTKQMSFTGIKKTFISIQRNILKILLRKKFTGIYFIKIRVQSISRKVSNYKKNLILFLKRFILIIAIYQICRILFYFINLESFNNLSTTVFAGGLLFDLAAVSYINIPFLIAHLLPGNFKYNNRYQKIVLLLFYIVNLAFIATNFIDIIYYRFTGRRSTFSMITADGMEHDAIRLLSSFLTEFWYIALLFVTTGLILWKLLPKSNRTIKIKKLTRRELSTKNFPYCRFNLCSSFNDSWRNTKEAYKDC